ncbi:MAG: pitrilysin family protein [Acidobacteriota bacterium]
MKLINRRCLANGIFGLLTLILGVASLSFGQTGTNPAAQAALVTEFDVNGLKVLIKKRPNSQTVSAGLFIRGGSRNLTPQSAGIESFALNAATEGSVKFPKAVLRRELARTGSSIGSGSNYDFSVLSLASTRQNFDRSWELFTDIAINPAFAQTDVDLTRDKILSALKGQEDDPDGFLQAMIEKTINVNTPYANDPDGTIENISRFKADDLKAYHKNLMQTSRLLLVIVGDLNPELLKQRIADSFGKLPRGNYKDAAFTGLDFSKPTLDVTTRSLPTNYVEGLFNAPSLNNPDYYAMRVATTLLRDRVFEEVRVKRNLSYAPNAEMSERGANTGNIYVTAVDANQAVSLMLQEIEKLKSVPVEEQDISGVSGQFLTTYFLGEETNAAQAAELARYEMLGGGWRNAFEYLAHIKQVKAGDVQNVAKKYMKNLRFVVVGNPSAINRTVFIPGS